MLTHKTNRVGLDLGLGVDSTYHNKHDRGRVRVMELGFGLGVGVGRIASRELEMPGTWKGEEMNAAELQLHATQIHRKRSDALKVVQNSMSKRPYSRASCRQCLTYQNSGQRCRFYRKIIAYTHLILEFASSVTRT